jgi:uncharacterized protein YdeI (YjbR/CyaY-like superfamily)
MPGGARGTGQGPCDGAGIITGDEQVTFPALPRDHHPASGHALPDLPPHRRAQAREPQRGPDRALPPGPSRRPLRPRGSRVPVNPAGNEAGEAVVIAFRDAAEFEAWLDAHAGLRAGVWLKIAKKGSGVPSLTDAEAVDLGLCYGWISGQRRALDEVHYLQKYVPRRPRSRWSRVNVARVEELIAAGRMRPSGLAEVEAAKADGRWAAAYESQRYATVPPDLAAALEASPRAARGFDALGRTRRYAVILELVTARTATARAARLRRAMTALEAGP